MPEWIEQYWLEWLFGILTTGIGLLLKLIWSRQKEQARRQAEQSVIQRALEEGLKGLLHDRIYEMNEKCLLKEHITISELDNLEYIYKPYRALKGNNTGEHMYNAMRSMPNKPV